MKKTFFTHYTLLLSLCLCIGCTIAQQPIAGGGGGPYSGINSNLYGSGDKSVVIPAYGREGAGGAYYGGNNRPFPGNSITDTQKGSAQSSLSPDNRFLGLLGGGGGLFGGNRGGGGGLFSNLLGALTGNRPNGYGGSGYPAAYPAPYPAPYPSYPGAYPGAYPVPSYPYYGGGGGFPGYGGGAYYG